MKASFSRGFVLAAILLALTASALATVPQQINYQGRLTDLNGDPLLGPVTLVFSICADSTCGNELWEETHNGVVLNDGLFSVILGTVTPLPLTVFDGSVRYLSASLNGQPVTRRIAIGSVGYSYRALVSDTAVAIRGGGTTDCADCNAVFVNTTGPDTVTSSSGTAFSGRAVGSQTSSLYGVKGYAANNSSGDACGGMFSTSNTGTGVHYGLVADAQAGSSGGSFGVRGLASNSSSGPVYAGQFVTGSDGTGDHYALQAYGLGTSSSEVYGLQATAQNTSSGPVYAASLTAASLGTGQHFGAYINSDGNGTLSMYGVWSEATNASSGNAYGGYFRGASGGTGDHIGVLGNGACASDATAYGSYGYATNTSTGDAYGGSFTASSSGTGVHYGAKSNAFGSSSSPVHGIQSIGRNTGSGSTYGGSFFANDDGTGHHYGIYTEASGTSANEPIALYGTASTQGSATAFGGYFAANGLAGSGIAEAVSGSATNDGTGDAIGVHGWAQNSGSAQAIGGYFGATGPETTSRVAVWADASGTSGAFYGPVFITGDLAIHGDFMVWGDKGAVVKGDDNQYRAVYCLESPENWFEDFGGARLVDGRAHIELDPLFLQSVTVDEKYEMRVFIQLEGSCRGVYVEKGSTGFDVIELSNGTGDAAFSYRVVAKRKGHEDDRLELFKGTTPEKSQEMRKTLNSQLEANRTRMQAEQQRAKLEQQAALQKATEPDVDE